MAEQAKPEQKVDPKDVELVTAPVFYASQVHIQVGSTDMQVLFQTSQPARYKGEIGNVAKVVDVAIMNMSLGTAKDLQVLLTDLVRDYEKANGEIKTEYTKKRAAEK